MDREKRWLAPLLAFRIKIRSWRRGGQRFTTRRAIILLRVTTMWTSSKPLNAIAWPRPARLAYLIPEDPPHVLLDVLIDESLSRWGGRRTPIIPTDGKSIAPAYWSFLNVWDADIIYCYVALSEELEDRIIRLFAPSEIHFHEGMTAHQDDRALRPDYARNFEFLSSLSLLPLFARRSQITGDALPAIVDKEMGVEVDRDLADSFGFASNRNNSLSLLPHAQRVSLQPKVDPQLAQRLREKVSYVSDAEQFVEMVVKRYDLLTLSRLSDMLCPHLRQFVELREGWNERMTIIVGDQPADRLLFWNSQHRYSALRGMDDIPILRLSPKRLQKGVPGWLKEWVCRRNNRHLYGNYGPQAAFRSCSLAKEELDEMVAALSDRHVVMVSSDHHTDPCVFGTREGSAPEGQEQLMGQDTSPWVYPREWTRTNVRFENNELDLPLNLPPHIRDISPSGLTMGVWAVDLRIERAEDHSPYSNKRHVWKWPRRLRLEQAIRFENYIPSYPTTLPPRIRPTGYGDVTIWDGDSWSRPILHLPRDYHAFALALERFAPGSVEEKKAVETDAPRHRFEVTISDKGRDLLGVLQHFQSLPEALGFLTDDFWCSVIQHLSPEEPANNGKSVAALAQRISSIVHEGGQQVFDPERLAKQALALAARSLASETESLKSATFEKFLEWAHELRKGGKRSEIRKRLTGSVTYLRDRGFLWQGYRWRCSFCQHHNWAPLERLLPLVNCEICHKPQSSPVAGGLDFRLNPFVQHAFASTSAQGPVLWCLGVLAGRATSSFAFAPTLDLYRPHGDSPETDVDLLAVVDGQVYVVEVKSSFAGVTPKSLEQLKHVVQEVRPDVAMLAVMDSRKSKGESAGIRAFESGLGVSDVCYELLTLDNARAHGFRIPFGVSIDKEMKWAAW